MTEQVIDGTLKSVSMAISVDESSLSLHRSKKGGVFARVRVHLNENTMAKVPFIGTEDYTNLHDALEDAGGGGIHRVSWLVSEPMFRARFGKDLRLGTWVVKTHGVYAKPWSSETTGDSGVSFKFSGFQFVEYGEGSTPVDYETALPAPDTRRDDEDEDEEDEE